VKYQGYNLSKGIPILFFSSFEIESEKNDTSNYLFDFIGENVHVEDWVVWRTHFPN
jgi:hypothetical protein